MQSRDERITLAAHRHDVARILGVLFKLLAQPSDVNVHGPGTDERLTLPNARQ